MSFEPSISDHNNSQGLPAKVELLEGVQVKYGTMFVLETWSLVCLASLLILTLDSCPHSPRAALAFFIPFEWVQRRITKTIKDLGKRLLTIFNFIFGCKVANSWRKHEKEREAEMHSINTLLNSCVTLMLIKLAVYFFSFS